jgi:predicted nucleic acid-binding Zn ribbon protein
MNSIDKQIEFISEWKESSYEIWLDSGDGWRDVELFADVVKSLEEIKSNTEALQSTQKKCPACGENFTSKNQLQECCSAKCRVRLHRNRNKLKNFNQKVNDILKTKDQDAKFTVEHLITSNDKCPFVVTYKGKQYTSDNTRNLLTQLKKI